jgi:hypothetical protein
MGGNRCVLTEVFLYDKYCRSLVIKDKGCVIRRGEKLKTYIKSKYNFEPTTASSWTNSLRSA